jgi:ABC-type amino acid transport system permease subunit
MHRPTPGIWFLQGFWWTIGAAGALVVLAAVVGAFALLFFAVLLMSRH